MELLHSLYAEIPFGHLIEVWANAALQELREEEPIVSALFSLNAQEELKKSLIRKIANQCAPTLAALMYLEKHNGRLQGGTPQERYLFFVETLFPRLQTPSHFPYLLKTISDCLAYWKEEAKEFASRLRADYEALQSLFSPSQALGKVATLSASLSDSHNGHRTTRQITFENGTLLGYKPKSLALDAALAELLAQFEEWGLQPALKLYRVYNRESYGWCEWLPTLPCKTKEEVHRYYERLGMWIGLVYLLGGTDCHGENLIASGEFPILVDLETLLHPMTKEPFSPVWDLSVFRTGFFPSYQQGVGYEFDVSPLTAEERQESAIPEAFWNQINTDQMEFSFKTIKVKIPTPRPKWRNQLTSSPDFLDELLRGFEKIYDLASQHKEELLSFVQGLAHHPVRCILRPTALYGKILQRLTAPKLMHSQEEREEALNVLARHCPFKHLPHFEQIVRAEKEALEQGDIPFFLCSPSSTDLFTSTRCIVPRCFEQSAFDTTKERLQNLKSQDKQRQMTYIFQSLLPFKKTKTTSSLAYRRAAVSQMMAEPQQLRETALAIGQKILDLSDPLTDGSLSWLALEVEPFQMRHVFHPLTPHLYSGYLGIALFFSALGQVTGALSFTEHAQKIAARHVLEMNKNLATSILANQPGGMVGLGSILYSLISIGDFLKEATALATHMTQKWIEQDTSFDVINGSAGLILALLALYDRTQNGSLLTIAQQAGMHLLHSAQQIDGGSAWASTDGFLPGFSHGTAGIAYALFKLAHRSGEKRFYDTAKQALIYDQMHRKSVRNQWCHGESGVALAQSCIESLYPEIQATYSLEWLLHRLRGRIDQLCCGNFGRLSILWTIARSRNDAELKKSVLRETARSLQGFCKTGKFCLYPAPLADIQNPSFMRGLAGIGYTLLRMLPEGEHLPEVLALQ